MVTRRIRAGLLLFIAIVFATGGARADSYPSRPITIVVGLAAGGITDVTMRIYAEFISRTIGQKIIIDNRPASSGVVAAIAVQSAPADGYTLLAFSGSQHATVPALQSAAYDPLNYQSITLLFNIANVLVVPAGSPVNNAAEFIDYGKKKKGGIFFGSPGLGTPSHMLAAKIAAAKGLAVEHVHYRGGGPMMTDLITGRVDFGLTSYTLSRAYIADGKLKALAIDAPNRLPELPNVPTFDEVGLGDARVASWFALAAPTGTPAEVVRVLHAEFVKASMNPELRKRLAENGTPITTTTPEEMRKLLAEEVVNTEQLVKQLGMRPKQ